MSLLDKASLVVTPNSYKESKLYSVVPNTTLGDMDVVRATTATRVNSAGLIEVVPRNLVTYSNTFSNAAWTKGSTITLTSEQTGYDGTNNAWLLSKGALQYSDIGQSVSNSGTKTLSLYAKANTNTNICLFAAASPSNFYQDFNLSTGSLGANSSGVVSTSIQSVGNGWYRCSVVFSGQTNSFNIFPDGILGANAGSVFIQDSQIESGSLTEYFPTTTRLNIPRIDYTNGSCPSLLVEPQRTNLLTYSNDFSNVVWLKSNVTISSNTTISPDGTQNASKIIENSLNTEHRIIAIIDGSNKVLSFFAKSAGRSWVSVLSLNGSYSYFNIGNGTLGTIQSGSTATIENFGNGWYKCSLYNTNDNFGAIIQLATSNNVNSYQGDGTSGIFVYGAQLEQGSYPTSYIPTVASSVTRNADVISKTGISSLIGQTEGTLFVDVNLTHSNTSGTAQYLMQVWLDGSNRIIIFRNSSNFLSYYFVKPGFTFNYDSTVNSNGRHKIAFAYKNGNSAFYIDGVQIELNTTTFGAFSSLSNFDLGIHTASGSPIEIGDYPYSSSQLYKTRLSNSELAQLTTL